MSDDPRGPAEPYRPPAQPGREPETTGPVRVPPPVERPVPQRPTPTAPGSEPARTPPSPPPPAQHRPPTDLDEFLARAVDRQIAEQRSLREALQELTSAVRELQSQPAPAPSAPPVDPAEIEARVARAVSSAVASSGPAIDPAELEARIARAVSSAPAPAPAVDPAEIEGRVARAVAQSTDVLVNELRDLRSTVVPSLQRATEASSGSRAIEHDLAILRDAVGGLSADVEGIAQALIDLNAGLRDWADGIDQNIEIVKETVQHVRDAASRAQELQAEAIEARDRRDDALPLLPVEDDVPSGVPRPDTSMVVGRDITSEIEQRVKETIELSLYLADQIESFDKAIANLGDLPTRLEGVISQALKRTLAARAKLDREAEMALDEAVATLDEHVATIGDLGSIADMQVRLEAGLDAIAEAIDRSGDGGLPRAGTALARASTRTSARKTDAKPSDGKGRAGRRKSASGQASRSSSAKRATSKSSAPKSSAPKSSAPKSSAPKSSAPKSSASKSSGAKRSASKRSSSKTSASKRKRTPEADYLSLDADPLDAAETTRPIADGD